MKNKSSQKGQVLVMLIVFVSIMTTVTAMAVSLMITNSSNAAKFENSVDLLQKAESGGELALLKLLRDPINYTGESFTIDDVSVTVNVTGNGTKTIESTSIFSDYTKKVEIVVNYPLDGSMTLVSWREVY